MLSALMLAACESQPQTATSTVTAQATASASAAHLTASQKAQVQAILSDNMDHYASAFIAGMAALHQPGNAFYNWRHSSNVEQDLSYLDAFKKADAFYNADNEPPAISTWRDDMGTVQADISAWVSVAVGWQIRQKSDADLAIAQQKISADVTAAQQDLAQIASSS
jgi:hypothetical protein